jgi:tRNA dimethylallyltransferase
LSGPPDEYRPRSPGGDSSRPNPPQPLRLLVVLGPTGTGKSDLAFELALRLDGEIVGCDALQVYRGLDAATAKPPAEYRRRVPHHLIDCTEPGQDFSLAEFVRRAEAAVTEIHERDRVPIVAGGTGLYLRGLLRGIVSSPPRDERLRERIHAMGRRRGSAALHRWLRRLDPASAKRLSAGDTQRVARAIEFVLLGDEPWSERLRREGTWASATERYLTLKIGLDSERSRLHERIDRRVDCFFDAGLVEEVRNLIDAGLAPEANALKAIGYREVLAAMRADEDPESVREEIKRNTRRYAKRQRTWFRSEPDLVWLDAEETTAEQVRRVLDLWRRSDDSRVR